MEGGHAAGRVHGQPCAAHRRRVQQLATDFLTQALATIGQDARSREPRQVKPLRSRSSYVALRYHSQASSCGPVTYPKPCLICDLVEGESTEFRHGLCRQCYQAVMADPLPACPQCAATVGPHTDTTTGCTECRGVTLIFERALCLGSYDGMLRDAILRMKFLPGEGLADLMGRVFAERLVDMIDATTIDAIV